MNRTKRYHLLDCLRLISIIAIAIFHCCEFIFYNDSIPVPDPDFFYLIVTFFARLIPFSGHSIIFLSFFLWGLTQKKIKFRLYYLLIFLFGHLVINYSFSDRLIDIFNWDIYPFLFVSFITLIKVEKTSRTTKTQLLITSLVLLFIPTHFFHFPIKEPLLADMIYGACESGLSGAWPLLPWIAFPIFSYTLGHLISGHGYKEKLSTISKRESFVWTSTLLLSFYLIYSLYPWSLFDVPIGANFYCFMLNLAPLNFWSYFIPFLFLVRVSFLSSLNRRLSQIKFFKFISALHWNTHFALTYVCQIVVLFIISYFNDYYKVHFVLFDIALIAVVPLSELLSRYVSPIIKKLTI